MFRTELIIAPAAQQLSAAARVLTLGSCFADSMGARLAADKVNVLVNPFGTVFQPLAAGRLLRVALGEDVDWQQHLVEARGRWQSYDLHGSQGAPTPVELLHDIQQTVRRTGEFLRGADAVLLTLGTAWAYRLRETGELVNNCHKMPTELFEKVLLTPDEIINALAETHAYLRRVNPKLRIILTVSPVRHLRDTLPLNAVSKSVLRVACHYLSELLPDVSYFPAFELLTDDLRDYRFYAADMLHPSEVAEDYVWEKFARTYFDADFGRFRKEWAGLRQALGHRPLNAAAPEHRQFLESTKERLEQLGRQRVNVAAELREVSERLSTLPMPVIPAFSQAASDDEERVDVGTETDGTAVATERPAGTPAATGERAPRLSPEEFRAQRAARNNNRNGRNRRNADQQTPLDEPIALAAPLAPAPFEPVEMAAPVADQTALSATDGAETDPAKKKKRRSRGGAKRTARKNAARLATAEAGEGAETLATDAESATFTEEMAAAPRNPQPEAPKSSVITKSVPVKRGGRDRGRTERTAAQPNATAAEVAPVTESAPESATVSPAAAGQPVSGASPAAETLVPAAPEPSNNRNRDDRRRQGPKTRPLFATPAVPTEAAAPDVPAARPAYEDRPKPGPSLAELLAPPLVRPAGPVAGRMRGATATLVTSTPAAKAAKPAAKATAKPVKPATTATKPAAKAAKPVARARAVKKAEKAEVTIPSAAEAKKTPAPRRQAKPAAAAPVAPTAAKRPAKPRAKKTAAPPDAGTD